MFAGQRYDQPLCPPRRARVGLLHFWGSPAGRITLHQATEVARQWFSFVGYYRFSGYWYPYRAKQPNGPRSSSFQPGVTFDQFVALYTFDRRLKLLVQDAVERIEIAMRVKFGRTLGRRGPFAHQDPTQLDQRFASSSRYADWQARLAKERSRSREDFVLHFRTSYDGDLPIWVATEILDFGALSILYSGMKRADRDTVAAQFGAVDARGQPNGFALASWFKQLNIIRNIVAHHSRLWNCNIGQRPALAPLRAIPALAGVTNTELDRLFGPLTIAAYLLQHVSPGSDWTTRVRRLIEAELAATGRDEDDMGFPTRWRQQPLWSP